MVRVVGLVWVVGGGLSGPREAGGIEIEIRYGLDTNGFFQQAGSREALRAVCDFFEGIIGDRLARIDESEWPASYSWQGTITHPGNGASGYSVGSQVVPEDTVILYAGGRSMSSAGLGGPGGWGASGSSAWLQLIRSRGQGSTDGPGASDIGIWGGSISFSTARQWNFSLSAPGGSGKVDFVPIALHEVAHALGFGTSDSWDAKLSGSSFTGPNSAAVFGRFVPVDPYGGHWQDDGACVWPTGHDPVNPKNVLSRTLGQFGVPSGLDQIALMDPSSCSAGSYLRVMTEVDVAGLADIGWQVAIEPEPAPDPELEISVNASGTSVRLTWRTGRGYSYQPQSSTDLDTWFDVGGPREGDGSVMSADPPAPSGDLTFYRLAITPNTGSGSLTLGAASVIAPVVPDSEPADVLLSAWKAPRVADGCEHCASGEPH